ncbi:Lipopolysaccharide kinase (Kdo/WaaP) family protein [Agrococcus baldri]|uniref:Lipopolysaccharide kinase (Kdo/WaaP) family protein n=2 Tax=Agrococcus baldri TaxID=153730 RepID=A0AA94HKZ2_9MICO|nr:Lipopolysaccharide kinase (Kdo/WaaP) family protein [Agrococcus baldri]
MRAYDGGMPSDLRITSALMDASLLDLPWDLPLEEWSEDDVVQLPKGISRHLVRFARLSGRVVAIKETTAEMANREYAMLRRLQRLDVPCVEPLAVIAERTDADGNPLAAALVTRHLRFSLPYRALYSSSMQEATAERLVDALAGLLVRLHLVGFYWGDVSLSNTLFRRDAGAFAAYLVDAETGTIESGGLSDGRRADDLEVARVNIAGELLDLAAGDRLDPTIDPIAVAGSIVEQYRSLWHELHSDQVIAADERWRIRDRIERLNALGFDIGELAIRTGDGGTTVAIQPKVVDPGHHHRRLQSLTGIDAQENQARRMLNDLDEYVAVQHDARPNVGDEALANEWFEQVFARVVAAVPLELRGKLEGPEVFHEVLEHRWFLSEQQQCEVTLEEATSSYIETQLAFKRDEAALLNVPTTMTMPIVTLQEQPGDDADEPDWRDLV